MIDQRFGEYWKPSKSKIVVDTKLSDGRTVLCFIVDPTYPNRWREEPWLSDIKQMAKLGIDGTLGQRWSTVVMVKGEKIPIIGSATLLRPVLA